MGKVRLFVLSHQGTNEHKQAKVNKPTKLNKQTKHNYKTHGYKEKLRMTNAMEFPMSSRYSGSID